MIWCGHIVMQPSFGSDPIVTFGTTRKTAERWPLHEPSCARLAPRAATADPFGSHRVIRMTSAVSFAACCWKRGPVQGCQDLAFCDGAVVPHRTLPDGGWL